MNVLIVYSSAFGSTKKVASQIASNLKKMADFTITLQSVDETGSLKEYDTVIIGSSIRANRILANVRDFIARFKTELSQKNIFFFVVCLTAKCNEGRNKAKREYIEPVFANYPQITPISIEAFGGKIETKSFNPVMKKLMRHVVDQAGLPQDTSIDLIDHDSINQWSDFIKQELYEKIKS